jgi:nucleotide-binding universal stress UspA family protein
MRILGCLDGTNTAQIQQAIAELINTSERVIGLIYVIDSGPRDEIGRKREQLLRPPGISSRHAGKMQAAEIATAQDILHEGSVVFPDAELLQQEGRPEREIVNVAASWQANIIVISAHSRYHAGPPIGPRSVGHTARFVLDHAPCSVLLVRPPVQNLIG